MCVCVREHLQMKTEKLFDNIGYELTSYTLTTATYYVTHAQTDDDKYCETEI